MYEVPLAILAGLIFFALSLYLNKVEGWLLYHKTEGGNGGPNPGAKDGPQRVVLRD